jgi:hypothetical protein
MDAYGCNRTEEHHQARQCCRATARMVNQGAPLVLIDLDAHGPYVHDFELGSKLHLSVGEPSMASTSPTTFSDSRMAHVRRALLETESTPLVA